MIEFAIVTLIFFFVGYFIGKRSDPIVDTVKYRARKLGVVLTNKAQGKASSGIIYRPDAARLRVIKGKKSLEQEALTETLDTLPEIQEAKKALHK